MPTYQITTDKGTYQVDTAGSQEVQPTSNQSDARNTPVAQNPSDDVNSALDNLSNTVSGGPSSSDNTLNFGDHAKMSFMDPQGQQDYLQKKYKYVQSDGKGNYLYGDDPNNLQPVNQEGIFNDFTAKLGNLTSSIPSIAGQIALTVGTDGLAIPALAARAALGAAAGQAGAGLVGAKLQNRLDPEKIATDAAIAGAFGGVGTAAGEALAGGAKAIAQKAGTALDNYRNGLVLAGQNPNSFDNGVSTVLHITTGLDKNTIQTGQKLGWDNIFSSKEATDPHGIATIAGDVSDAANAKEMALGKDVDTATKSLIKDTNGGDVINTAPVASRLLEDLSSVGILNKTDPNSMLKSYGINMTRASNANDLSQIPSYTINKNSPLNTSFFQKFLGELGVNGEGGSFKTYQIDPSKPSMISVADALKIKQGFQAIVNEGKSLTPVEANLAKRALYGNLEENVSGLSDQLSKVAQKVGNVQYPTANGAFSDFMKLTGNLKKAGMDVDNPFNSQNFLLHVNNASPLTQPLLQKLDNTLGNNFLQRAQAWGVNSKISDIRPNFFRLGMIGSLFGAGLLDEGGPGGRAGKLIAAGALGTPTGLRFLLKGAAGGSGSVLRGLVNSSNAVAQGSSNKSAQAVISQLLRKNTLGS